MSRTPHRRLGASHAQPKLTTTYTLPPKPSGGARILRIATQPAPTPDARAIAIISNPSDTQRNASAITMKSSLIAHAHARASPLLHNPKWSRSFIPTLADLSSITSHVPAEIREQVLTPPRPLTQFEIADGKPMAFDTSKSSPANSTLEAMAALFREEIAPATQALNTRTGYWGGWRALVTFMFLQGAIA